MKIGILIASAALSVFMGLAQGAEPQIKLLTQSPLNGSLSDLKSQMSAHAKLPVSTEGAPRPQLLERLFGGEAADIAIMTNAAIQELAAKGLVRMQKELLVSEVGIAVAADARAPTLKTKTDFVAFLKSTPSFAYPAPNATGPHPVGAFTVTLLEQLGLTSVVAPKATVVSGGLMGGLVRDGKVAAAIQIVSELKFQGASNTVPLPEEIQMRTPMSIAVLETTSHEKEATALVQFLTSPEAAAVYRRWGLVPSFK